MSQARLQTIYIDEHENYVVDIPKEFIEQLNLKEGSDISVNVVDGRIVIRKEVVSTIRGNKELI